jgi:hypothetical protein
MGSRTRAAEQRVEEQRRRIGAMLEELETRVGTDVENVRSGVSGRVEAISARLSGAGEAMPGADAVRAQVNEHPLTSMVGGFGAGVALGMLTAGDSGSDEDEPPRRERRSESRHGGAGMTSRLVAMLTGPAIMSTIAAPVENEVRSLVQELFSGFLGNDRAAAPSARAQHREPTAREPRSTSTPGGVSGTPSGSSGR